MNLINKDYISIEFMYKWLTEELYNRKISHDVMEVFYKMVAEWRHTNESK